MVYELRIISVEILYKDRKRIKPGICLEYNHDHKPLLVKTFASPEKAMEELGKRKTTVIYMGKYFLVTEYYVEESEYDEDGYWISGGDIWGYSEFDADAIALLNSAICDRRW